MKHRRLSFLFFIIVFLGHNGAAGLYLCYWTASVQNGIRSRENGEMRGEIWVILGVLSLGIGFLIWQWRTSAWMKRQGLRDLRIWTSLLSLLLIGLIVNPFLIQNEINKLIAREAN